MKRIVAVGLVIGSVVAFTSCNKTTICNYTDPETGEVLTDTVTTKRVLHKNAVKQHTKTGWTCS